ncbi:hypothetical protein GQ53DRAFT_439047 [Thozetella sp. PMI_491]|nr:hypothetical protein GQ53DRAFT_439047 [Thozetella sp. PMI_491]
MPWVSGRDNSMVCEEEEKGQPGNGVVGGDMRRKGQDVARRAGRMRLFRSKLSLALVSKVGWGEVARVAEHRRTFGDGIRDLAWEVPRSTSWRRVEGIESRERGLRMRAWIDDVVKTREKEKEVREPPISARCQSTFDQAHLKSWVLPRTPPRPHWSAERPPGPPPSLLNPCAREGQAKRERSCCDGESTLQTRRETGGLPITRNDLCVV